MLFFCFSTYHGLGILNYMINMPSPNYNTRPDGVIINSIIIHYTGMKTAQEALDRLCDPQSKVSAHYTIDMDGTIYNHVSPDKRAWHAGVSSWGDLSNFNDFSIGIELVNKGHEHGYHDFPKAQIDALISLIKDLYQSYPIDPRLVLGHSDIAPDRKQDPGELFPWDRLVQENLAIRP
jgi:N-acetylmuramoyl-L-alanine amidase